jgi:centromere protein C
MQLQESEYTAADMIVTLPDKHIKTNQLFRTGSAPDVDETLNMRKTPRFPPPRATTPRHTNIGSPKRMSSARPQSRNADMASDISPNRALSQPPANRVLNFGRQNVRADTGSPFKPTKVLRRSFGGVQRAQTEDLAMSPPESYSKPELPTVDTNMINEEDEDAQEATDQEVEAGAGADLHSDESYGGAAQVYVEDDQPADDAPPMFNDEDDFYNTQGDAEADEVDITEALEHAEVLLQTTPTAAPHTKKGRGRPRKSDKSTEASIVEQASPNGSTASNSKKRNRAEIEDDQDDEGNETVQSIEQSQNEVSHASASSENPAKRARGRPRKNQIPVLQDATEPTVADVDHTIQNVDEGDDEPWQVSTATAADKPAKRGRGRPPKNDVTIIEDNNVQTIDPADVAYGDSYLAPVMEDDEADEAPASPVTETKPEKKAKAQKATKSRNMPKERDPNQSIRRTPSASPGKVDRDRTLILSPSKRAGSVSNVNLRATTPFEDAHQRLSRSGRPIMAPLKHWAGESYVWKNGEVEGIIRADEVKTPRGSKKKGSKTKRRVPRAGRRGNDLDIIAEESDTESTVPDDWEEQIGVIAGTVAAWDPDAQQGNPEIPIREGIFGLQSLPEITY